MAARKSCTHLTWAEAKARLGTTTPGGSSSTSSNNKNKSDNIKRQQASTHRDLLAQKIIAKQHQAAAATATGGATTSATTTATATTITRAQQRRQDRADTKASVNLAAARELQRQAKEPELVTTSEWAQRRLRKLVQDWHNNHNHAYSTTMTTAEPTAPCGNRNGSCETPVEMTKVAECRQIQLEEIMALEAMFADSGEFQISDACRKQDLEDILEQYHENPDDPTILQSLGRHPDLAFTLALTMDDHQGLFRNEDHALLDLVAFVVVQISFPQFYPLYGMPPDIQLLDIMLTSHTAPPIRTDKTLESCVHMRHDALHAQMLQECHLCLPELCIYDVVSTWLSDHLFEFAELRTHAVLP